MTKPIAIPEALGTFAEGGGGFLLPDEAATQGFAILAKRDSGKSNVAACIMETFAARGDAFICIDPASAHHGIRARAGKDGLPAGPSGLQVLIVGGEHGDVPLDPNAGAELAQLIIETNISCVVDINDLRTGDRRKFICALADEVYRRNRTPRHLILEEADELIPQTIDNKDEMPVRAALRRIIKGGRSKGLGFTIITQRTAMVDKTSLYMIDNLIAMAVVGPGDIKAIKQWTEMHTADADKRKEVLESLPKLPAGTGWVISPTWLNAIERVRFRRRVTYHAGRTPKRGEAPVVVKYDVTDVARMFQAKVQERGIAQQQQRDEVVDLRKQLAEARAQLGAMATRPTPTVDEAEVRRLAAQVERRRLEAALPAIQSLVAKAEHYVHQHNTRLNELHAGGVDIAGKLREAAERLAALLADTQVPTPTMPATIPGENPAPLVKRIVLPAPATSQDPGEYLPPGEKAILVAAAGHSGGATLTQLSVLTGYKRSARDTYVQRLRAKGYIEKSGDTVRATPAGVAALGSDYVPMPTGLDLQKYWLERLPVGERKVLDVLIDNVNLGNAVESGLAKESLRDATGYKRSALDTYVQRLAARKLVTSAAGVVTPARELFA